MSSEKQFDINIVWGTLKDRNYVVIQYVTVFFIPYFAQPLRKHSNRHHFYITRFN